VLSIVEKRRARLATAALAASVPSAAASDLAISSAAAFRVREPSGGRSYAILRLETRSGLRGYGECPTMLAAELEQVRSVLAGKPATAFEVVGRDIGRCIGAAVNMALLDILGKSTATPVYQFLGGPTRFRVRAMAPLTGASDAALADSLKRARDAGFRTVLVPVPPPSAPVQGQAFVLAARKRLDMLREAGRGAVEFVLDGAGALSAGDAASLTAAFETSHLLWFDEPCPAPHMTALRKLTAERVTPIGFGRRVEDASLFQELLRDGSLDVLRPDIGRNGLTQIRRMAVLAETRYVAVAPFHDGGPIGTAAALHLAASLPNFFVQQIPFPEAEADRNLRAELTGVPVEQVTDGYAALPAGPGLGINVNEQVLARHGERV